MTESQPERLNPFFSNSSEIFFTARKFTGDASRKDNNLLIIVYIFILISCKDNAIFLFNLIFLPVFSIIVKYLQESPMMFGVMS